MQCQKWHPPASCICHPPWRYCGRELDWVTRVRPESLEAGYHSSSFHTSKISHFSDLPNFHFICDIQRKQSVEFSCDRWTGGYGSSHVVQSTLLNSLLAYHKQQTGWRCYTSKAPGVGRISFQSRSQSLNDELIPSFQNFISFQLKLSPGPWS